MDTIKDIKKQITDEFMADSTAIEKFGLTSADEFDKKFKVGTMINLLFYLVASVVYIREKVHDMWLSDVEKTALATRYGTKQWWHKQALNWQKGDSIEVDENGVLGYKTQDEEKKIIKYAAIVNEGRNIYIKVAKKQGEELVALSSEEKIEFQAYLDEIKPLGIKTIGQSGAACELEIKINVYYDRQREKTAIENSVKTAIKEYLNGIIFGGEVVKNKIIDAVQEVSGVSDVEIENITYNDNAKKGTMQRILQARSGYYTMKECLVNLVRS